MATLRKITLNWEIRTGAITCDTGYIKRQELCDVDLYVTVDGTAYALDTSWALNLSIKPTLLGDNAALIAVTTWTASATTGLYQATAQTMGGTALDTYLAANNSDTTDDEGNKLVDLDVYYTISTAVKSKSDTVTLILKPDVGRADDTVPATIIARNDFLVTNGTGLLVNVAAGYAANGAFVAAQASLAITNATNYIEVTAAGVASVNTTAFTAGSYPLATVIASAGAITANTDLRAWITPKPATGGGVTSITGTANEITVTGTTTPTLSLPSALTFTGKTVTGGTFASPTLTTPTIGDGTESAPSLSFTTDANTGVYRPAADTVGIVGGGNDVVRMTGIASATDYIEIKNGIGVGSPLHVLAEGASANIGVHLQPKGSGLLTISDGTDFNKGIRFRSSSSAASAITLLDAVSTAGRVITLPDATGTLALVSGDLGTPSALVGTNITGTAASLTAGTVTTNANLTGHVTSVGNAAVLGSFTFAQLNTAVSDADLARTSSTNTFTGVQSLTSPDITTSITTPSTSFTAFAGATTLMTLGGTGASASTFFPSTLDATSSITGAIRTSGGISAAKAANFGTTIRGGSSLTLGAAGGTVGSVVLNGSTSSAATITVSADGTLAMPSGTYNSITSNSTMSAATVIAQNQTIAAIGIDISSLNSGTQVTAGHPWMRVGGAGSESLFLNAGLTGGYVAITKDLGDGILLGDGTGGNSTYLKTPATGTLRVTTNGSTLGTVDAATFTGNAATVTTNANMTGDVTSVGNATTLAAGSASALNSGTLADARLSANVPLKDAANTFTNTQSMTSPAITTSITTPSTTFAIANTTATTLNIGGAATTIAMGAAGEGTMNIPLTTSASSAITGALTIGNGTAATNVGIGGGNINAGGTLKLGGAITLNGILNIQSVTDPQFDRLWFGGNRASKPEIVSFSANTPSQGVLFELFSVGDPANLTNYEVGRVAIGNPASAFGSVDFTLDTAKAGSGTLRGIRLRAGGVQGLYNGPTGGINIGGTTDPGANNLSVAGTASITGNTTITGNLTSNGALISTPQALTGAGAVNVTTLTTAVTTTAPAQALTLADGTNGQIKTIVHKALSGGGTWVLTPTTKTGYTTITSTAVGETCTLQFFTTIGWCILSLRGAIAA